MGSSELMSNPLYLFAIDVGYLLLALAMLVLGKYTLNVLTPFKVDDQLTSKDNSAFGVSLIGYYLGILIVFIGASYGEVRGSVVLWKDMASDAAWAGLLAFSSSTWRD